MPELAEVAFYKNKWMPAQGLKIKQVALNQQVRVFRKAPTTEIYTRLPGATLTMGETHGKQMIFLFDDRFWLGVHLGMAGRLSFEATTYKIQKHDHLCLETDKGWAVFTDTRHFGRIRFNESRSAPEWWARLPPKIGSEHFTLPRMEAFLRRRKGACIKAVLLMQEQFPGLGNWMVDEILWRSKIHPATTAGLIGEKKRAELFSKILEVESDAMRVIGKNWGDPPDHWLFNHRWKDGGTCPKTGTTLKRATIGGRTTCWSPKHQTYRGLKK